MNLRKLFSFPIKFTSGFLEDECYLWASALSYYTLLSIVPIFAIVFGIAKGFGFENLLEEQLKDLFYQQPLFADKLIDFAKSTLENSYGSLIAGAGVISLFWSTVGLLGSFEGALNRIWNISNGRSFHEKVIDYLPLVIFGPILVLTLSSGAFFLINGIVRFSVEQGVYSAFKPAIQSSYYFLLLLLTWGLFIFLYTYIPNRSVPWRSCIIASFFTALALLIIQWAYLHLQIYLTSYNAIYGSLAAIPLFLIWLQLSWLIVLAGAEFAKQIAVLREKGPLAITKREVYLLAFLTCCRAYLNREPPITAHVLADKLSLNLFICEQILTCFQENGLLIQTTTGDVKTGFIPSAPPDKIHLDEVLAAVSREGNLPYHVNDSPERTLVVDTLANWDAEKRDLSGNRSIESLMTGFTR